MMKAIVSIVLIVCGVLLVAIPPVSDAWQAMLVARLLEHGFNNVNIDGVRLQDGYRFGCWFLGAAMIAVGAFAGLRGTPAPAAVRPPQLAAAV